MRQKKLLLLGGLRYLVPVIEAAHQLGAHVITCDYIPNNIAHKYSDEYHNVSIIDKDAVLKLARELGIDGIMSFAVDPGVVTAAYVAEQMGLPNVGPYESVCILQDKARFREFLRANNFRCPWSYDFSSEEAALQQMDKFTYPAIVKPTDAAGSKGVSKVDSSAELAAAVGHAFDNSLYGNIIIEEFIDKRGCSSGSEAFIENGELRYVSFASQRFDESAANPYTPAGTSWPSTFTAEEEHELTCEIQRLIRLLGMKSAIYNIETRVSTQGIPYIMEVSPRGGGNRLAEMLQYATGAPLVENAVRAALGMECKPMPPCEYKGHWFLMMIHADKDGIFDELSIHPDFASLVIETDLWVKKGSPVRKFNAANDAIGSLFFHCHSQAQIEEIVNNTQNIVFVKLQ